MVCQNDNIFISIIVPVYNEESELSTLIPHLCDLQQQGCEVIVIDGGSKDNTVKLLRQAKMNVAISPKGRAIQMNYGASIAKGELFIFLHADTYLPSNSLNELIQKFDRSSLLYNKYTWGRFDVKIKSNLFLLKIVSLMINLRSRITKIATGDQTIFITKNQFNAVGGFPSQPLMEDVELCKRLKAQSFPYNQPLCLAVKVQTSGRRWEKYGVCKTIFLMWKLRWLYWRGVSASELAKEYK